MVDEMKNDIIQNNDDGGENDDSGSEEEKSGQKKTTDQTREKKEAKLMKQLSSQYEVAKWIANARLKAIRKTTNEELMRHEKLQRAKTFSPALMIGDLVTGGEYTKETRRFKLMNTGAIHQWM